MISETKSSVKPQVNNTKSASEASIEQGFDFKSYINECSDNIYELFVENIPNKQIV